ncbi:LAQU0S06e01068g1_1 [Lachancea quebecensis]|uniref:Pre-mRNA-splicing factor SLU7 n=1 Tax=Lachancea quebecensis TaxID=1654605 RepID=A0A0P1KYY2_9SACH|nr:LAQU0S06e01068g1_1 [Lachancea quebecensis]
MSKRQENVHIPKYIKDQPWFYKSSTKGSEENEDYLAHHRRHNRPDSDLDIDNNAEPKVGRGITDAYEQHTEVSRPRFAKAKCLNCGAGDHISRDCLEAPRKRRAGPEAQVRTTVIRRTESDGNWDARRDRWFGYEGKEYETVLQKWEDNAAKQREQAAGDKDIADELDTDEEIELAALGLFKDEATGAVAADDEQGSKLRTSVRLREDRAAYLDDINSETINYDPKSRLYKSDTLGEVDSESKMFHRHLTGESLELSKLSRFAREKTLESGIRDEMEDEAKTRHVLVANPTKYELLMKKEKGSVPLKTEDLYRGQSAKKLTGTKKSEEQKAQLFKKYG